MTRPIAQARLRFLLWGWFDVFAAAALGAAGLILLAIAMQAAGVPDVPRRAVVLTSLVGLLGWGGYRSATLLRAFWDRSRIVRLIESSHPEYQDLLTTEEYLSQKADEADRLGFSPELVRAVHAEVEHLPGPRWERLGLAGAGRRTPTAVSAVMIVAAAAVWMLVPSDLRNSALTVFASGDRSPDTALDGPQLAPVVEVPLHRVLTIPSTDSTEPSLVGPGALPVGVTEFLARSGSGEWKPIGSVTVDGNGAVIGEPIALKVGGEMQVTALSGSRRGNTARIVPVYPPAVVSYSVGLQPPGYTGRPPRFEVSPSRVEAMSGTVAALDWETNNALAAARLEIYSETGERIASTDALIAADQRAASEITLAGAGSFRLWMKDRFDQEALSTPVPYTASPDQPPTARILSPTREVVLNETLQIPLSVTAADDVSVSRVELVFRLDNGIGTNPEVRQDLFASQAGDPQSATTVLCSGLLDVSQLELWPGDQVVYWIESHDWRGPDRPGVVSRSETYTARYPSVEEVMDERAAMTSESVDGLQDLLEEQEEIARQFQEMRREIQSTQSADDKAQRKFETEKRLQETVERQAAVQEQLNEMADQFAESLQRLEENNDISLRTLQKFERVQELLDEVLSQEAKDILRELQETLKKMQENQLRPEELDKTEMTLEEFEKQLDRQLELLENMWFEQSVEALQEQAEELAMLQEELQKATQELHNEKNPDDPLTDEEVEAEENPLEEKPLDEQLSEMAQELKKQLEEQQNADAAEKQEDAESARDQPQTAETNPESNPEEAQKSEAGESEQEQAEGLKEAEGEQEQTADSDKTEGSESEQAEAEQQAADAQEQDQTDEGLKPEEQEQTADAGQQPESPDQQSNGEQQPQTGDQEKLLADRQEQLNKETEALIEELKRLREEAERKEHSMSESLSRVAESQACESLSDQQQQAMENLQQNQTAQAAKKQSQAKKSLQQMSDALAGCCGGSNKDMEENIAKMKEILERAFILSEESERNDQALSVYRGMPQWPNPERMSRLGREMGFFRQEALRLSNDYQKISEQNPFADFSVVKHFDQAARNWRENTQVMEEAQPSTISLRAHQSLGRVNLAIDRLMESIDQSQSQAGGGNGLESYFRSLKQMLSEQRKLNNQTQQMKDQMEGSQNQRTPGEANPTGSSMEEQMQRMAEQQRNVRRQIEQLEQQYQQMKQRAGGLEGASELMKEVEKELEEGRLNEQVTETQKKIEQRLLDAERSLHERGYKRKRKALNAEGDPIEGETPTDSVPLTPAEEEELARLLQDNLREVSPHWRDRVRAYYDELLKTTP